MKENCIVSIGVGHWYPKGIDRLRKSLERNFDGDFIGLTEYPKGCPTHQEIPYGFKPWAFFEMSLRGYKRIMWMDASFWAIKSVNPLFEHMAKTGHLMIDAGHYVGVWTSDRVLKNFGVPRDHAMNIPMFIAGGFGLDLTHHKSSIFLDTWWALANDGGSFHGKWHNNDRTESDDPRCHGHRHDMSVASLIAANMGFNFLPNNTYIAYYEWYQKYKDNPDFDTRSIALLLQGM